MNQPAGADATPDRGDPSKASPRFRFPLPFDPVRLLAGVLSRWPWIAVGMIVFGTLGTLAGVWMTRPSYTLSLSLIKRRVPHTVQASETGQAYRPVELNDATLLATLLATEPLDLALKRSNNGIDPNTVRTFVEAKQLEGTDIFYTTYRSPISPEDAVAFSSIWAEEINAYTQRLQRTEAHEVRLILQNEVADLERQMADTNLEILNFSKEKDYLGGESQVAAVLSKLSLIELQLETARTTVVAKQEQLKNFTLQIQRQSPIELQSKTAKEELANLRATYTDANPLVQTKLQSLEYLGGQIQKLGEEGGTDLDAYTGTPLGNQLYLSILDLRNQLLEANSQIHSLEKLYKTTAARIDEFPGIINTYTTLQKKSTSITEGLSLMSNRLKEAEIFASGAPGYWQVFQAPDHRRIIPSSLVVKPVALGAACGILGAGFAAMLTLLFTHRTSRRSILECCAATHAPLVARIPNTVEKDARAAIDHFWITHLAPRLHTQTHILFWTPALDPADERQLWSMLASAAWADTGKPIRVHDLTPDSLWSDSALPDSLEWAFHRAPMAPPSQPSSSSRHFAATPEPRRGQELPMLPSKPSSHHFTATLLRASCLPHGDAREHLARVDYWMAVVAGQKNSLRRAAKFRPLTDTYLPPCNGTIAWVERPAGPIRETADLVSGFLTQRFS